MRGAAPVFLITILAACQAPTPPPAGGGATAAPSASVASAPAEPAASSASARWRAPVLLGDRRKAGPPLLGPIEPAALEEIVGAAPQAQPRATGENGGTAVGTETGAPGGHDAVRQVDEPEPPRSRVTVGDVTLVGAMSSPAIEKAARAQLYWTLVQRCRGPDGAILPPDSVTLSFTVDADGYLTPASILATAADPRHEEAAACMRKELSGIPFRMPAGARGQPTPVTATVPSID